jgi:hypothetical protein
MGFLDDYLLGRKQERNNLDNSFLRDNANARITRFTPQGIQFQGVDARASSKGAATALLRTTGSIPQGFFNNNQGGLDNIITFDEVGGDTFNRLQDAGIGEGSLVSDLYKALQNKNNQINSASNLNINTDGLDFNTGNSAQSALANNSSSSINAVNNLNRTNSSIDDLMFVRPSDRPRGESNLTDFINNLNENEINRNNGPAPFGSRTSNSNSNNNTAVDPRNFGNVTKTFLSSFIEDLFNLNSGDYSELDNDINENQNFSGRGGRDLRFLQGNERR